jgi:ATP-dependent helicase/nuclease subunit A
MTTPAYQANGRAVERGQFYALACDPQRSVVVEACAGAGKTWMLVSRMLRALLEGAHPQEILAITFTRKAAGEMRQRLNDWLREFAAPGVTDERRAQELVLRGMSPTRAAQLAGDLAQLHERVLCSGRTVQISTFHAWFSQLLRAAPLELLAELGLQSGMALIEELDDHREEVFRRFHTALLRDESGADDYRTLVHRRGRSQVRKWLEAALNKRVELELADEAGTLDDSVPPADTEGGSPCAALLGEGWKSTLRELAIELAKGGVKAQDAATGLVMALGHAHADAVFSHAWRALFTASDTPRKQLGKVPELPRIQAELECVFKNLQQHEAHDEHRRMVRLSRVLGAEFAAYKRARGLADMADLERCALAMLRDATLSGWVQERLDSRIRHLLIDEFQDTSPLQWHALHSWLDAYAGAGGGASGQRPPGVFIVGDPKQSIYRFRGAEPRVFDAARRFVADGLGGDVLACDHTRRNAPEILTALNHVFLRAVEQGDYDGFRAHTTEVLPIASAGVRALPPVERAAITKGQGADPTVWRDSLTTPRHEPEEVLRQQEAHRVAQAIRELVANGNARPGEIYVLCRTRASLRLAARELQALHIPHAASEDFALMDAIEARDLIAVLDVLASPQHDLSLAQALRSPLFSAPDDALIALASIAKPGGWWRALTEREHDDHPTLQRAARLMSTWRAAAEHLPPHDLLDRIVSEGDYRERVAATVPAEQRLTALDAIDALLAQALMLDGARYSTPYNFVRALKRRAIRVAAPVQLDAVQLLTVHGAKGLEAKVVFVMDVQPESPRAETVTLLVDWPVDAEAPQRCAFIYSASRCPPALAAAMAHELAARQREELNGLYVAMSRARELLVFSRTEPRSVATGSWWSRVEDVSQPWEPRHATALTDADAQVPIELPALPTWTGALADGARSADATESANEDDAASRLGQAVHRVLEWAATASRSALDPRQLADAAAREFNAPAAEVVRISGAILANPACRVFFDDAALGWAGNEVPVADAGDLLRIDRLVALDEPEGRVWWVLDYKISLRPGEQQVYREQLLRYRSAVQRLQPGDAVRCGLIDGAGRLIELD